MTLASGSVLGPYEIQSLLGAGGMGEVYRARDPRLGRDIALKVLPPSFAADPDRLRRFEQEARAVAALSHPNIVALYDIGQSDGTSWIATELLEGESLREILGRGPLSHRKAVAWATQIAQGLAAAHARNIVHRDLKPDNLFITRDGQAKILDFGLAKAVEKSGAAKSGAHADATLTVPGTATGEGIVMGTVGYMSPEQVRGAAADARTDIFSFGVVLYEMLTGQRAFKRDTAAETMTAILNEDPPEFQDSGQRIPPALERIVRHCLEKSPDHRFQSARDLAFDLDSLSALTGSAPIAAAKGSRSRAWIAPAVLAALVLVAGFLGWRLALILHPAHGARFHELTYRRGAADNARYSPDGRTVYYTAAWEGAQPEIYSVPLNESSGHPLGIANARLLAVSKQGELAVALAPQSVTLLDPGALAHVAQDTAPRPEIENIQAADFDPDGSLAIVRYLPAQAMCQLEYPIGHILVRAPAILSVRLSPNGKYLAYDTHLDATDDRGNLVIVRTDGRQVALSPLYESVQGLAWNPSGSEVWFTSPLESGEIHAMSLSGKMRTPLSVAGRLFLRDIAANGQILADQGIVRRGFIYSTIDGTTQRDLSWLDYGFFRAISNDGKTVLFEEEGTAVSNSTYTVFVRGTDGSAAVALGPGYGLALSRDKQWALADKLAQPVSEVWLLPVGAGEARRLSPPTLSPGIAASFLPDGQQVVYIAHEAGRPMRSWLQNVNGAPPRPITPEGVRGWLVSPDGKWLMAGKGAADALHFDLLVPLDGGPAQPIPGLKPNEMIIGWTADGQIYSFIPGSPDNSMLHFEKVNPHSGAHTPFRDIAIPRIAGASLSDLFFTPDGSAYTWGYRFALSDLYTIDGAS
ncbi:MAG TPA: protein kinase [Acidobacteriaceae bacterium]|jgi:Tol biopolymer transport system component|nr:protein kinase [Acidobacteriaceae bacterium]